MTVRPPRGLAGRVLETPASALDYEIAQEKATTLGRLGRALEAALAELRAFDEARAAQPHATASTEPAETGTPAAERRVLVAAAGVALWNFVVQREACGLRDSAVIVREYRVPPEVRARMNAFPILA